MVERIFHKMYEMVAWNNFKLGALGFTQDDFKDILNAVTDSWDTRDQVDVLSGILNNMTISFGDKKRYPKLENKLDVEFYSLFKNKNLWDSCEKLSPTYDFDEEDSKRYIMDYLEAYRYTHKTINYDEKSIVGGKKLFVVSLHRKQNMFDKMKNDYGAKLDEISFSSDQIKQITGTTMNFKLSLLQSSSADYEKWLEFPFDNHWC